VRRGLLRVLLHPAVSGLGLGLSCLGVAGLMVWGVDLYQQALEQRARPESSGWTLPLGEPAANFRLPAVEGDQEVSLADHAGKPVVLFFGSFTCDVFCSRLARIERLYADARDKAAFLFVNVREAGHRSAGLEFLLDDIDARFSIDKRRANVRRAIRLKGFSIPALLDTPQANVERLYEAFPLRCVVVDAAGDLAMDLGPALGTSESWDMDKVQSWLERAAPGGG
jgi:hypothetical protein